MSFDERAFRDALGAFATGIVIVTGISEEHRRLGMTVSSFNSVSIEPPLVLFSLARRSHSFEAWRRLRRYAINVLSQDQEQLSNKFARPSHDKWSATNLIRSESDLPLFANAIAAFECEAYAQYDGGDHEIFVGRVLAQHIGDRRHNHPLIFYGGRYRRLDAGYHDAAATGASLFEGW
jgi:flavin reductase (DIM6/NTAB) family NADH-FMN oxidoreductase RutF